MASDTISGWSVLVTLEARILADITAASAMASTFEKYQREWHCHCDGRQLSQKFMASWKSAGDLSRIWRSGQVCEVGDKNWNSDTSNPQTLFTWTSWLNAICWLCCIWQAHYWLFNDWYDKLTVFVPDTDSVYFYFLMSMIDTLCTLCCMTRLIARFEFSMSTWTCSV